MESNAQPQQVESNVSLEAMLSTSTVPVQQQVVTPPAGDPQQTPATVIPNTTSSTTNGNSVEQSTAPTVIQELQASDLDDDTKKFRDDIFTLFKGESLDKEGNLLNGEGKVVVTATDLEKYITDEDLVLDEAGNAVNALGEIILTKESIDAKIPNPIDAIRSSIETNFGIQFPADLVIEDNIDGITKLVESAVQVQAQNTLKDFLDQEPEIKAYYHHLKLGGTFDTYQASNIDYSGINIKTVDESTKIDLLTKMFKLQGNPSADAMVDLIKKGGEEILNQNATMAVKYLQDKQTERNKHNEVALQQKYQQEIQETEQYWKQVNETVTKGKLNQIDIPVKDREAFFNYMAVPVDKNMNSADNLAEDQDPLEFKLLVSYLRWKKGDISELAKNIAKTDKVKSLSELMAKHKGRNESGVPRTSSAKPSSGGSISLETLLGNK